MLTIDETLIESATQTLASKFHPEQIWLFGSHTWGAPTSDSDLDLMVVVRDSDEPAIRRSQRALRCLRGLPMPKDVIVPTRAQVDRYKHLRASLFHQIPFTRNQPATRRVIAGDTPPPFSQDFP